MKNEDIEKLLSDKMWHSVYDFMPLAIEIPPEIAIRRYVRTANKKHRESQGKKPLDQQIAKGRLRIILQRLNHRVRSGTLEAKGRGRDKQFRTISNGSDNGSK